MSLITNELPGYVSRYLEERDFADMAHRAGEAVARTVDTVVEHTVDFAHYLKDTIPVVAERTASALNLDQEYAYVAERGRAAWEKLKARRTKTAPYAGGVVVASLFDRTGSTIDAPQGPIEAPVSPVVERVDTLILAPVEEVADTSVAEVVVSQQTPEGDHEPDQEPEEPAVVIEAPITSVTDHPDALFLPAGGMTPLALGEGITETTGLNFADLPPVPMINPDEQAAPALAEPIHVDTSLLDDVMRATDAEPVVVGLDGRSALRADRAQQSAPRRYKTVAAPYATAITEVPLVPVGDEAKTARSDKGRRIGLAMLALSQLAPTAPHHDHQPIPAAVIQSVDAVAKPAITPAGEHSSVDFKATMDQILHKSAPAPWRVEAPTTTIAPLVAEAPKVQSGFDLLPSASQAMNIANDLQIEQEQAKLDAFRAALPTPVEYDSTLMNREIEPQVMGKLSIPKLELDTPVYDAITQKALDQKGVLHWEGTATPGQPGNAVFDAHRTAGPALFGRIAELGAGDFATFTDADGTMHFYAYERTDVYTPDQVDEMVNQELEAGKPQNYLSFITCKPTTRPDGTIDMMGERTVVRLKQVAMSSPVVVPTSAEQMAAEGVL